MSEILLIEDSDADIELVRRSVRSDVGQAMHVERSVQSGLAWLQRLRDAGQRLPRLILLDLNLPGDDGHQALRAIRADQRTTYLPVVVLSSSREPKDVRRAYDEGANSYVCKPVELGRFRAAIQAIERYWIDTATAFDSS